MYTLLIAIIYLAFVSLGLPDSLLGSAWPIMHQDLGVSISFMGVISMVISVGTVISSLFSDKLTKRFGTNKVTTVSVFLTAIALFGFSYSKSLWIVMVFAIPYGFGAGAIDAALNNYVAVHYSSKHMSWLHSFWGVGTIISPFIMSWALTNRTWDMGFRIVSLIQLAIAMLLLITLPIWKINKNTEEELIEIHKSITLIEALKIKGVPQLLLGFLGYCAAEVTAMSWSCTYLVKAEEMDEPTAAAFASLFFIGMTVGRFVGGFIMDKLGDRRMIRIGTAIIILGITCMIIPVQSTILSLIGLIMLGLGCAPIYPCIIHSTPNNFGAENSGAIIGIQMASAYIGATFIPPLFGVIGNASTFAIFPIYILFFIIIMILMVDKTFKITAGNNI